MKGALGKKKLLEVVPLSWSTIERLEAAGEFPKRWYITDRRCAWTQEEVEQWLEERKKIARKYSREKSHRLNCGNTAL